MERSEHGDTYNIVTVAECGVNCERCVIKGGKRKKKRKKLREREGGREN